MNAQNETKINQLLQKLPVGAIATTRWLQSIGINLSLVTAYVKSGWLDRIGVGAVARRGSKIEWQGAVYALQRQLGLSVHPGGKTALGLRGALHYIPLRASPVMLFCRNGENIPRWFSTYDWKIQIKVIRTDLFGDEEHLGLTDIDVGAITLKASSSERAIMEYLYLLNKADISDEPLKLMEGLAWLRPDVVQQMLESCRSVKVKRLFLVLAENANHPWMKKLHLEKVSIGKGKRQFVHGGHLHPRFLITIPQSWNRAEAMA